MEKSFISKAFLIFLLIGILISCYLIFQPFLVEILVATILVTIFYRPFEWLVAKFKGKRSIASLVMCILIALLVIIPISNFIIFAAQESVEAYERISKFLETESLDELFQKPFLRGVYEYIASSDQIKDVLLQAATKLNNWLVSGAGSVIVGTTNFLISLVLIIFTMFFFFIDGKDMLSKVMYWTPLPNKYDREIFKKFSDVSYSTMLSTFVTAAAQGLIGSFGLWIAGVPVFFAGMAMAFLSLLPYVGSAIVWVPISIYLLAIGNIWQGVFLIIWGAVVVGNADNLIRAYIIRGKAQVHPIFVILSILGGISMFGFWGVIFGPLIISLAVTILHIYEMEFGHTLEKEND